MAARPTLPDIIRELEAGDSLLVDTSHTVRLGAHVDRIVLELLPLVAPVGGVHLHDLLPPNEDSRGTSSTRAARRSSTCCTPS